MAVLGFADAVLMFDDAVFVPMNTFPCLGDDLIGVTSKFDDGGVDGLHAFFD